MTMISKRVAFASGQNKASCIQDKACNSQVRGRMPSSSSKFPLASSSTIDTHKHTCVINLQRPCRQNPCSRSLLGCRKRFEGLASARPSRRGGAWMVITHVVSSDFGSLVALDSSLKFYSRFRLLVLLARVASSYFGGLRLIPSSGTKNWTIQSRVVNSGAQRFSPATSRFSPAGETDLQFLQKQFIEKLKRF
jgi:hypothetical protein